MFKAFAQCLPQMVTAGWNRFLGFTLAGRDPRKDRNYVDILFLSLKGGSGGTHGADGYDHIGLINCGGGILAQDYEMFEIQDPHFLMKHEYLEDSAGAGEWRGGLGIETVFRIDGEDVMGVAFGDGIEEQARAFGLFGGKQGAINEVSLTAPDGTVRVPKAKEILRGLPQGTIFAQKAGGGGGYGDPRKRPAEAVLADVRNGLVSAEVARRDYGVAIDTARWQVDETETRRLRG
jgi:N-methylhydantoinase B